MNENPATVYTSQLDSSGSNCPSQDTIKKEHRRIRKSLLVCSCGGPGWTRVAYLNIQ